MTLSDAASQFSGAGFQSAARRVYFGECHPEGSATVFVAWQSGHAFEFTDRRC